MDLQDRDSLITEPEPAPAYADADTNGNELGISAAAPSPPEVFPQALGAVMSESQGGDTGEGGAANAAPGTARTEGPGSGADFDVDKAKREDLEAEIERRRGEGREIEVEATGANGEPKVDDLRAAIRKDDESSGSGE